MSDTPYWFKPEPAEQPARHHDDVAIDRFAKAMKAKMAKQRAKGYGGWDDRTDCPTEHLQQMLVDHIAKGDPVDVANFAMMLWSRGERTEQPAQQGPVAFVTDNYSRDGVNDEISAYLPVGTRIYTSPPPSKPLTNEQFAIEWYRRTGRIMGTDKMLLLQAKYVTEAAHGIKGDA